jgi:alpha-glucosidase
MLLLTLRGTPTLYYGDELGMENVAIPPERVQDPWEKNEPGLGLGRDPSRTPMPWDGSRHAGFTTGEPWLPLSPDHARRNVARMAQDPGSILTLYRRLIALRRAHPALHAGSYATVASEGEVFAYERRHANGERLLVALNLGQEPQRLALPGAGLPPARVLLSSALDRTDEAVAGELALRPDEGVVLSLAANGARPAA